MRRQQTLSRFTIEVNNTITDTLPRKQTPQPAYEVQPLIEQTAKEIQILSAILERVLPADDSHTVIDRPKQITVIADCLCTFKVPCFNKQSPCRISIRYLQKETVRVYVSQTESRPSEKASEQQLTSPALITILSRTPYFASHYIFLSFTSQESAILSVSPSFFE